MTTIEQEWAEFKTRGGVFKYRDLGDKYILWKNDEEIVWKCSLTQDGTSEVTDFEDNYQDDIDNRLNIYASRTPDDIPVVTTMKNFSWNAVNRVTHDFADKRTWYQGSSSSTGMSCTLDTGDTYDLPTDLICPYLISDRDLLGGTYDFTIKDNGVTTTDYTVDYVNHQITFNSSPTGPITCDGYTAGSSDYTLTPDSGKYWLVDYIEIQVSQGATFNDTLSFDLVLNHAGTGNADYTAGSTTFNTAKDFLNKSNYGNSFAAFGELSTNTIILPWNFVTGYKIFPVGNADVIPAQMEFNKLKASLVNDEVMTNCEVATATFYCYERSL